jgi:hypothetical protein
MNIPEINPLLFSWIDNNQISSFASDCVEKYVVAQGILAKVDYICFRLWQAVLHLFQNSAWDQATCHLKHYYIEKLAEHNIYQEDLDDLVKQSLHFRVAKFADEMLRQGLDAYQTFIDYEATELDFTNGCIQEKEFFENLQATLNPNFLLNSVTFDFVRESLLEKISYYSFPQKISDIPLYIHRMIKDQIKKVRGEKTTWDELINDLENYYLWKATNRKLIPLSLQDEKSQLLFNKAKHQARQFAADLIQQHLKISHSFSGLSQRELTQIQYSHQENWFYRHINEEDAHPLYVLDTISLNPVRDLAAKTIEQYAWPQEGSKLFDYIIFRVRNAFLRLVGRSAWQQTKGEITNYLLMKAVNKEIFPLRVSTTDDRVYIDAAKESAEEFAENLLLKAQETQQNFMNISQDEIDRDLFLYNERLLFRHLEVNYNSLMCHQYCINSFREKSDSIRNEAISLKFPSNNLPMIA